MIIILPPSVDGGRFFFVINGIRGKRFDFEKRDNMTLYELMILNKSMLKMLSDYGITMEDFQHIQLFKDYLYIKAKYKKTSYAIQEVATKYKMSERTVYRIVKRFHSFCQNVAVE